MPVSAKVICDSVSPEGDRLTTLECTFHRFILAEFNTHRAFSRNSASSRAIPITKTTAQVTLDPAMPVVFRKEQPGMSGGEVLENQEQLQAMWRQDAEYMAQRADLYSQMGVHKSIVNRIIEPYMWHTAVVTSTDWENFLEQRMGEGSQPEMIALAYRMDEALRASVPQRVNYGGWHLPYITDADKAILNVEDQKAVSVARVAGVSYNRLGTIRELQKDFALYLRLREANPPHWSPFEHVATPSDLIMPGAVEGNFDGWRQLRHILANKDAKNEY